MPSPSPTAPVPSAVLPPPARRGRVPVWLHVVAGFVVGAVAFFGVFAAGFVFARHRVDSAAGFIALGVAAFVAQAAATEVLMRAVPARCRACGGRAWGRNSYVSRRTIKYACEHCGRVSDTGVSPAVS